jgi:ABC-type protease/lipase transport system fused ATPase/permease subunit
MFKKGKYKIELGLIMKLRTRSILQELNEIADRRDTEALIESRATNIINSAINLIESIHKHYDEETALELERRLINSIKGSDTSKFVRGIRKITEDKRNKKDVG